MKKPRKTGAKPSTAKRLRRTSEDARAQILDVAERRLLEVGPGGIRLQEISKEVGMSHPLILHHFESREGLVRAVVDRALVTLQEDLVVAFANVTPGQVPDGADMLDRVFATLHDRGHGRLLAWLALSGYDDEALDTKAIKSNWKTINDAMHALRIMKIEEARAAGNTNLRVPPYEDTVFTVALSAITLFGQSIAGASVFKWAGIGADRASQTRFRHWFSSVLITHMENQAKPE